MPDLTQLKLIVGLREDGTYVADYVNADRLPDGAPTSLAILFEPNRFAGPNGLIDLQSDPLSTEDLRRILDRARERPRQRMPSAPEIEDTQDLTARAAGGRSRRGQGFRQSPEQRAAIDWHAMTEATEWLETKGWEVKDRSINHPYDLFCKRGTEKLHVEVKGTTSDGMAVLLTPNEVEFARGAFPEMALLIVAGVELSIDETGKAQASGGEVEFVSPWDIDSEGKLKPTGLIYDRELPAE